jgi:hypothetical protein
MYRELAATNPVYFPDLAMALGNLRNRYIEAGNPGLADAAWEQTVAGADPTTGAYLLVTRASAADAGDPGSAAWLVDALRLGGNHVELTTAVHGQARRHRAVNPADFDSQWTERTGEPAPEWLTVDARLLVLRDAQDEHEDDIHGEQVETDGSGAY